MSEGHVPCLSPKKVQVAKMLPRPSVVRMSNIRRLSAAGVKNSANLHFLQQAKARSFNSGLGLLMLSMVTNSAFSTFDVYFPYLVWAVLWLVHGFTFGSLPWESLIWGEDFCVGKWLKVLHFYTLENGDVVLLKSTPFYLAVVRLGVAVLNIVTIDNFRRQGFFSSGIAYVFKLVNSSLASWLECECWASLVQLFITCRTTKSLLYCAVILITSVGNWTALVWHYVQLNLSHFEYSSMDPAIGLHYVAFMVLDSMLITSISVMENRSLKFFWTLILLIALMKVLTMYFKCPGVTGMTRCVLLGGLWWYMLLNACFLMAALFLWETPSPYKPLILLMNFITSYLISFVIFWKRKKIASAVALSNMSEWTEDAIYDLFTLCGKSSPLFNSVAFHDALNDKFPFSLRIMLLSNYILMTIPGQVKKVFTSVLRFAWKGQFSWLYRMRIRVLLELATPEALPSDKWSSIVEQQVVEIVEACQACHANFWSAILNEDFDGVIRKARILHQVVSKASDFFRQIEDTQMMSDGISEIYLKFIGEIEANPSKFIEFADKNMLKQSVADNVAKMKDGVALEGIIPRATEMRSNITQYPKMQKLNSDGTIYSIEKASDSRYTALCYVFVVCSFWLVAVFVASILEVHNLSVVKQSSASYDRLSYPFSLLFTFVSEGIQYDLDFGVLTADASPELKHERMRQLNEMQMAILKEKSWGNWNMSRAIAVHSAHHVMQTIDDLTKAEWFQAKIESGVNATKIMGAGMAKSIPTLYQQMREIKRKQYGLMLFIGVATGICALLQLVMLKKAYTAVGHLALQAWGIPMGRVARLFRYFHGQSKSVSKMPTSVFIIPYSWLLAIPIIIGLEIFLCLFIFLLIIERHLMTSHAFFSVISSFPVFISSVLIPFRTAATDEEWKNKQMDYCYVGNVLYRLIGKNKNMTQFMATCQTPEVRELSSVFEPIDNAFSLFGLSQRDVTDDLVEIDLIIPKNLDNYRAIENREVFVSHSAMVTAFKSTRSYSKIVTLLIASGRDSYFLLELFCMFTIILMWAAWVIHIGVHCYVFYHFDTFTSFLRRALVVLPNAYLDADEESAVPGEVKSSTQQVLNVLPCGIVVLDEHMDRVYDNKYAQKHFFPLHMSGKHQISGHMFSFRSTAVSNFPLGPLDEPWQGSKYVSFVDVSDMAWLDQEITRLARLRSDYENAVIPQYFRSSKRTKFKKHESFVFTQCSFVLIDIPKGRSHDLEAKISLIASGRPTFMYMDMQGSFLFLTFVSTDNSNARIAKRDAFHCAMDIYELLMTGNRTADARIVTMTGPMIYKFATGPKLSLMIYGSAIAKALRILGATAEGEMSFTASMKTSGELFFADRKATCRFNKAVVHFCTIDYNYRRHTTYSQAVLPVNV